MLRPGSNLQPSGHRQRGLAPWKPKIHFCFLPAPSKYMIPGGSKNSDCLRVPKGWVGKHCYNTLKSIQRRTVIYPFRQSCSEVRPEVLLERIWFGQGNSTLSHTLNPGQVCRDQCPSTNLHWPVLNVLFPRSINFQSQRHRRAGLRFRAVTWEGGSKDERTEILAHVETWNTPAHGVNPNHLGRERLLRQVCCLYTNIASPLLLITVEYTYILVNIQFHICYCPQPYTLG